MGLFNSPWHHSLNYPKALPVSLTYNTGMEGFQSYWCHLYKYSKRGEDSHVEQDSRRRLAY